METSNGEVPSIQPAQMLKAKIELRIKKALDNPLITPKQKQEVYTLANLTNLAVYLGNPVALTFGKEFIKLTDSLTVGQKTWEDKK